MIARNHPDEYPRINWVGVADPHFLDRCECGLMLTQCRCIGPKTERIVRPCKHVPTTKTVVSPADQEAAKANLFGRTRKEGVS